MIGCGSIGTRHIENLLALGVRDIVTFDTRRARREAVARSLGVRTAETLECAWDGRNVAIVATPSSMHVPVATEAVERGCHLLIEKPLSDSFAGVETLLETARRNRSIALVGCNMRFHPGLAQVKRLVDQRAAGPIVSARAEMGQYLPDWRPKEDYRKSYSARHDLGGGIILDAIHEIDYLLWMLGVVSSVTCFAGRLSHLEIDVEDTAAVLLRFANGVIGELHLDYVQRHYSRACRIVGELGTITWDFGTAEVRLFTVSAGRWETVLASPEWQLNDMYVAQMRHFLRCLDGAEQPLVSLEDGARALAVAIAAKQSALSGSAERPIGTGFMTQRTGDERVIAIVQARMSSTRLPGKTLADINGKPMLLHVVERVRRAGGVDQVLVATSDRPSDDPLAAVCDANDVLCFRGSENDVLDRFYRAARAHSATTVVRITADCPLLDGSVLDKTVAKYRGGGYDYVANNLEHTYPDGLDVEVFSFAALERAWREATQPAEREHVTPYLRQARGFRRGDVPYAGHHNVADLRWTVDEPRDLEFVRAIYARFAPEEAFGMEDIAKLLAETPELAHLNDGIVSNEGYYRSLVGESVLPPRTRTLERSGELLRRAKQVIPSGTQTFSKAPTQFVQNVAPAFLVRGQGSHVWDADGNEYIDYPMALGPIILGHNYPAVTEAVTRQAAEGTIFSLAHPLEIELAERLVRLIPCAEMVRFAKNGSDATAGAVRVARAFTGRDRIACCGYHGWQDWYIGTTTRARGVPLAVRELTRTFNYNDIASLERIFADSPGQIAGVVMEPVGVVQPGNGFLEAVRDLTRREGALLIFDEIVTGFRFSLGGAQELFGVIPDLACFGKAMANGYPLAAIVGRRDIMEIFDEIFFSFTFGGDVIAIAAALATITELEQKGVLVHLHAQGRKLKDGYNVLARHFGLDEQTTCVGLDARTAVTFRDRSGAESLLYKSLVQQECLKRGVLFGGAHNLCFSHSDADIDHTLRTYRAALEILATAIERDDVVQRLDGPRVEPVFRRV